MVIGFGGLGFCLPAKADSIRSIFIDFAGSSQSRPLVYVFDPQTQTGELSIIIPSAIAIVTRDVSGNDVQSALIDVSLSVQASALTDTSSGQHASGEFSQVSFALTQNGSGDTLLSGQRSIPVGLAYEETFVPDQRMFLNGVSIPITGGTLASEFDVAAQLFGFGYSVSPGISNFDRLDRDHTAAVALSLINVPEPGTALLAVMGFICFRRLHRVSFSKRQGGCKLQGLTKIT